MKSELRQEYNYLMSLLPDDSIEKKRWLIELEITVIKEQYSKKQSKATLKKLEQRLAILEMQELLIK